MLFANVCAGFISSCSGECCYWIFLGFLVSSWCIWRGLALLVSLLCTRLGFHRCASCWTRPLGGGRWGHYLCNLRREYLTNHSVAYMFFGIRGCDLKIEPYMLPLVGRPSLHGYYACMAYWAPGALWRNCRQKQRETFFPSMGFFLLSRNSRERFWGLILCFFLGWDGQASWAGLPVQSFWC